MRRTFNMVCVLCALVIAGCSGGSSGGGGTDEQLTGQLLQAKTVLGQGEIEQANLDYTNIIEGVVTNTASVAKSVFKSNWSENSEARFGRALTNMILLIEQSPSTAILAGFGQLPWGTETVFTSSGYLYTDEKTNLPFYNLSTCVNEFKDIYFPGRYNEWRFADERCLLGNVTSGYNASAMIASMLQYEPYFDSIIDDLLVAINTASASFTVPKELYNGDADIQVNHADMVQILAGMYAGKAALDLAASWEFSFDISSLYDSHGVFKSTKTAVVDALNTNFALKSPNYLDNARTNLQNAFRYTQQAMEEVLAGAANGILDLSSDNTQIFTELKAMADAGLSAFDGQVDLPYMTATPPPQLVGNLDSFFTDPPNGADISDYDPFVYNLTYGRIGIVEAFWQDMLNKTGCNYNLLTHQKVKIFSEQVRAQQHKWRLLFDEIIGHKFGNHYAGRPLSSSSSSMSSTSAPVNTNGAAVNVNAAPPASK